MSLLSLILSLNFPATAEDETVPVPVAVLVGLALVPALVDPRIVRPLAPPAVLDQEFAVITNAMDAAASYPDSALSVVDSAPDLDLDSASALVLEWNTD